MVFFFLDGTFAEVILSPVYFLFQQHTGNQTFANPLLHLNYCRIHTTCLPSLNVNLRHRKHLRLWKTKQKNEKILFLKTERKSCFAGAIILIPLKSHNPMRIIHGHSEFITICFKRSGPNIVSLIFRTKFWNLGSCDI